MHRARGRFGNVHATIADVLQVQRRAGAVDQHRDVVEVLEKVGRRFSRGVGLLPSTSVVGFCWVQGIDGPFPAVMTQSILRGIVD